MSSSQIQTTNPTQTVGGDSHRRSGNSSKFNIINGKLVILILLITGSFAGVLTPPDSLFGKHHEPLQESQSPLISGGYLPVHLYLGFLNVCFLLSMTTLCYVLYNHHISIHLYVVLAMFTGAYFICSLSLTTRGASITLVGLTVLTAPLSLFLLIKVDRARENAEIREDNMIVEAREREETENKEEAKKFRDAILANMAATADTLAAIQIMMEEGRAARETAQV